MARNRHYENYEESYLNSTSTALGSSATYTGTWEEVIGFGSIIVAVKTDTSCTLYVDFSPDGTNLDSTLTYPITAGVVDPPHRLTITRKWFRVRVVNGSSAQTYMRLQTTFGEYQPLTSTLSSSISQYADTLITRPLDPQFTLAEGKWNGHTLVQKFGQNSDVDAAEDIWDGGGNFTGFPTSAETVQVISSSAEDGAGTATGALTMRIYGLDANYDLQEEDVTLNGTTGVSTTNTFIRVHRAMVLTSGSALGNVGALTIRQSSTTANVFSVIAAGIGQSRVTAYTIPAGYTGYIIRYSAAMFDNTANNGIITLKAKLFGSNTWLLLRPFGVSTAYTAEKTIYGGLQFPEKTDGIMRCTTINNANANITAEWDMLLVKN